MASRTKWSVYALLGLLASIAPGCTRITEFGPESGTTGGTSAGGSASTSLLPGTAQAAGTMPMLSSSGETTGIGDSSGDPGGCSLADFICEPDGGSHEQMECSLTEPECPRGEKCVAWANDGGSAWNATKCVPVDAMPDGAGERCTVEGSGVTGIDSCAAGSMCWDVDGETLEGECVSFCVGPNSDLSCEEPGFSCQAGSLLSLCVRSCDPLAPMPCPEGSACYPGRELTICAPDASGPDLGAAFDGCAYVNACDSGLLCGAAQEVGACARGDAQCCTPWCDLDAPDCPAPTSCQPYLPEGTAPPGFESVGFCGQGMGGG